MVLYGLTKTKNRIKVGVLRLTRPF
jgi:hypothetical protein